MKWIVCLVATALLVCCSHQARIRRQFGQFDYPTQFFPNQAPQNQFGGPGGVLFPQQGGFNQGNGFDQGQGGFNGQNGNQGGFNGQNGNQGGFNGQTGGQNFNQGNQGFPQNGGQQGNFQQGGGQQQGGNQGQRQPGGGQQQGGNQGQRQQVTTQAPAPTAPPTTLAPQLQNCVDGCIGITTNQYNPVCGTDMQTYHNQERLDCARQCGVNLRLARSGVCRTLLSAVLTGILPPG